MYLSTPSPLLSCPKPLFFRRWLVQFRHRRPKSARGAHLLGTALPRPCFTPQVLAQMRSVLMVLSENPDFVFVHSLKTECHFHLMWCSYPPQSDYHFCCQWCLALCPAPSSSAWGSDVFSEYTEFFLPVCSQIILEEPTLLSHRFPLCLEPSNKASRRLQFHDYQIGLHRGCESAALGTAVMKGFRGSVVDPFSSPILPWIKTPGESKSTVALCSLCCYNWPITGEMGIGRENHDSRDHAPPPPRPPSF